MSFSIFSRHSNYQWILQARSLTLLLLGAVIRQFKSMALVLRFVLLSLTLMCRCVGHLYLKHVKTNDNGKVKGRKHWGLTARDLADKLNVHVHEDSLKTQRSNVVIWSKRPDAQAIDWKAARETIRAAYPALFEVCAFAFLVMWPPTSVAVVVLFIGCSARQQDPHAGGSDRER